MKTLIISFFAAAGLIFCAALYFGQIEQAPVEQTGSLHTARVKRGDLSRTIEAKGTVKLEQVEVGAQVTGRIADFGLDAANGKPLDCGSHVKKDALLAQIDQTIYQAQVDCAEASVSKAKANLAQARCKLDQSAHEWKRAESLHPISGIADSDYDIALTNFRMAEANVSVWEAAVQESEASLRIAKTNLGYTTIKAPCDGVIIDRRVNVGQTVVAAFNAPGLFLIAKDSRQMQVWASVNEAEIGYIRAGLPVRFSVSACLGKSFEGRVEQVRLNPTKAQGEISYTVVVSAENYGAMMPDMTANLQFVLEQRPNVLLISNDALGWPLKSSFDASGIEVQETTPGGETAQPAAEQAISQAGLILARKAAKLWRECKVNQRLWVKEGESLRAIDVQIGASNGFMTEITGHNVREGMEVVFGGSPHEKKRTAFSGL